MSSHDSIVGIIRHLEASGASLVHLRADAAPVFWKGNERLPPAGFPVLREVDLRRSIAAPLTDDQLATFRKTNFLSVPLRFVEWPGTFQFEASLRDGREELVVSSCERLNPWGLFRDHRDLLEEALRSPEDADVYWNLAMEFLAEDESQLAWHALVRALELAPDDGSICLQLGKVLGHDLRRVEEAITVLERARELAEPSPEVHVELAVMLRSSNRPGEAEAAVQRGLAAFPDDPSLMEAHGVLLLELERPEEAAVVLERSLQLHGADREIETLLREARAARVPSTGPTPR